MKLFDLVEVGAEDDELPDLVEVGAEDDELPDCVEVAEEDEGFFSGADEASLSRVPQVSVALSSTSWAERDTDGFRVFSPGSSMTESS